MYSQVGSAGHGMRFATEQEENVPIMIRSLELFVPTATTT